MAKTRAEQEQSIQYPPARRMNTRNTALSKATRKMLGIEQRKMLGIVITTKLADAGFGAMGHIERTSVGEMATTIEHNEEIWHSFKGSEFQSYMKAYLHDVLIQTGGNFQTLYDVAAEGITELVAGTVLVDEPEESVWQRLFGGG